MWKYSMLVTYEINRYYIQSNIPMFVQNHLLVSIRVRVDRFKPRYAVEKFVYGIVILYYSYPTTTITFVETQNLVDAYVYSSKNNK